MNIYINVYILPILLFFFHLRCIFSNFLFIFFVLTLCFSFFLSASPFVLNPLFIFIFLLPLHPVVPTSCVSSSLSPSDSSYYHVPHASPAPLLMDDLTRILIYCSINNITSYSALSSPFSPLPSPPLTAPYPPDTLQPLPFLSLLLPHAVPLSPSLSPHLCLKFTLLIQSELHHFNAFTKIIKTHLPARQIPLTVRIFYHFYFFSHSKSKLLSSQQLPTPIAHTLYCTLQEYTGGLSGIYSDPLRFA